MTQIYHEGNLLNTVVKAEYTQTYKNNTTTAKFTLIDPSEVQAISSTDLIEIEENGTVIWTGKVTKTPETLKTDERFEIEAEQIYGELLDLNTNGRLIYNKPRSEALEQIVTTKIENRGTKIVETFSDLTNTTSNAPVIELANFRELRPERIGTDLAYIGFPVDNTPDTNYTTTVSNLDYKGDTFQELQLELLLNNSLSTISLKIQYIDKNNNNYVWDVGSADGYETLILSPTEATEQNLQNGLDPSTDTKKLRLFVNITGSLIESKAIGLDAVKITSSDTTNRNIDFTTNIPQDNTIVKREFNNSVSEAIYNMYRGTGKKVIIEDDTNTLTVRSKGDTTAPLTIDNDTSIISWDVKTDSNKPTNNIVIQGAREIIAKNSNLASEDTYGIKTKKIRDTSIQSQTEANIQAQNYLEDNSFKDTDIEVTIPTTQSVINSKVGNSIEIGILGVNGTAIIKQKTINTNGTTTLLIEGKSKSL